MTKSTKTWLFWGGLVCLLVIVRNRIIAGIKGSKGSDGYVPSDSNWRGF